jgi:hypothetical protein
MLDYRHIDVIYCDDIRHEVGNKLSFIGIYTGELLVQSFPVTLPKLCLFVSVSTPIDRPFQKLRFLILKDDEVLLESEIPQQELVTTQALARDTSDPTAESPRLTAHIELVATPLVFNTPVKIRVRVVTESEELKGRALRVLQQPPTAPTKRLNS